MTDPRMTPTNDAPVTVERCVAKIMDERAAYFERTTGHFDRADAARSYRATKAELMKGLAALASAPAGWIVGNGSGTQWRTWDFCGPVWTTDREKATRYARREDAEAVHAEDEDAWTVQPYAASAPAGDGVEAWHPIDAITDQRRYGGPLNLYDPAYDKSADNFGASWDGYWNDGDGTDDPDTGGHWVAAVWCNDHDEWHSTRINPTHYREPPAPPGAQAPVAASAGWVLVPVVPTPEQIQSGCDGNPTDWAEHTPASFPEEVATNVYASMIRAAALAGPRAAVGERSREAGLRHAVSEAKRSLRLVQGCLECNADDERRWAETIEWLERLA